MRVECGKIYIEKGDCEDLGLRNNHLLRWPYWVHLMRHPRFLSSLNSDRYYPHVQPTHAIATLLFSLLCFFLALEG